MCSQRKREMDKTIIALIFLSILVCEMLLTSAAPTRHHKHHKRHAAEKHSNRISKHAERHHRLHKRDVTDLTAVDPNTPRSRVKRHHLRRRSTMPFMVVSITLNKPTKQQRQRLNRGAIIAEM
ncbi:uncharacterized protein LOC106165840 [Lingula anatina]|uniref:Uncharacterized protein LOC106165840 n=1 Tax=Lingula anatina TaxID=7574 RepID=A0A1S3IP29_LINAN|nr:uncharacterized protein LOC106165840 [Lingula anatina]|eukprot:XP_013399656.1 uncharacterized protein LOC106165840 [Lingula anatina]